MKTRPMKVSIYYLARGELSLVHNSKPKHIWVIQNKGGMFQSRMEKKLSRVFAPPIDYTSTYFQKMSLHTKKHPFTDRLYKTLREALQSFPTNVHYVMIDVYGYSCDNVASPSPHHEVNATIFIYGSESAFDTLPRYKIWNIPCPNLPQLPVDLDKHIRKDTDYLQAEIRKLVCDAYERGVSLGIELGRNK